MKIPILIFFVFSFFQNSYCQRWKQYADSARTAEGIDKAIAYYLKAVEELKKDSILTASYASVCHSLGGLYLVKNEFKVSEAFYLESKEVRTKVLGKKSIDYAISCHFLAELYSDMNRFEEAEQLYLEAQQIFVEADGRDGYVDVVSSKALASLYWKMGKYQKAEELFLYAKLVMEKNNRQEDSEYAEICNNLGLLYREFWQYEKAMPLYLESRRSFERLYGKDHYVYATSLNNLGDLYMEMGQFEKAELLYIESKEIRGRILGKEDPAYAQSCNNLADLYLGLGQFEKAELLLIESKKIIEKAMGKENSEYAQSCNNLGILYKHMREYEEAEPLLLEAKNINETSLGKDHPVYMVNCSNLAGLYIELRHYIKAEGLLLEIKRSRERILGKKNIDYAHSCNALGSLYVKTGQFEKAGLYLREANLIYESVVGNEHQYFAVNCENLVKLYWITKQPALAEAFIMKAAKAEKKQLEQIFRFTGEREKQEFIENVAYSYDIHQSYFFSRSAFPQGGASYNLAIENRNLILAASSQLREVVYFSRDSSLQELYLTWISLKELLASAYVKPRDERTPEILKLEEEAGKLEKQLSRSTAGFSGQAKLGEVSWKTIQQALTQNEAAIEFVEFHFSNGKQLTDSTFYVALLLRKDKSEPRIIPLFEKKQLGDLLNNESSLQNIQSWYSFHEPNKTSSNSTSTLASLIWYPLEEHLGGITKIYFATAGLLNKVSFAAFPLTASQVLCDKYQLVQVSSTASVIGKPADTLGSSAKIQLHGGIQYDVDPGRLKEAVSHYTSTINKSTRSFPEDLDRGGSWKYLPGSETEISKIQKLGNEMGFTIAVSKGLVASEESIKALSGKASPDVLHIATHGFFFPDPNDDTAGKFLENFGSSGKVFKQSDNPLFRSGLVFAGANNAWKGQPVEGIEDGILTAYEVTNMYLPNSKLVVLSACETALGDIRGTEGVYGLQRAFRIAGVQNLVMSLWKVPDIETAEFMELFYKNLFSKQKIRDAFFNAQKIMRNKYRDEPFKWAAWVLIR